MRTAIHYCTAAGFVAVLLLPLSQTWLQWAPTAPLKGVEAPPEVPALSRSEVFDGLVSAAWRRSFEHHLGLRDVIVRTENHLNWLVFGTLKDPNFAGRDNFVFRHSYAPGSDWASQPTSRAIRGIVQALSIGQRALRTGGIQVIPLISPIKTRFLADLLPADQRAVAAIDVPTKRDVFLAAAEQRSLEFFDTPGFFRDLKPRALAPLFPRGGIHWSNYAATEVLIELLRRADERSEKSFFQYEICETWVEDPPLEPDADVAGVSNIWTPEDLSAPGLEVRIRRIPDTGRHRPRILLVGTSFVWNLAQFHGDQNGPEIEIYYYNKTHYRMDGRQRVRVGPVPGQSDPSFLDELRRFDVLVIEAPEHAVEQMNWDGLFEKIAIAVGGPR